MNELVTGKVDKVAFEKPFLGKASFQVGMAFEDCVLIVTVDGHPKLAGQKADVIMKVFRKP